MGVVNNVFARLKAELGNEADRLADGVRRDLKVLAGVEYLEEVSHKLPSLDKKLLVAGLLFARLLGRACFPALVRRQIAGLGAGFLLLVVINRWQGN